MSIKIDIPSYLQPYTNNMQVVEVNGRTVIECLNHLIKQFPEINKMIFAKEDKLLDYVSIFINGNFTYTDELSTTVKDRDELNILYIIGGG